MKRDYMLVPKDGKGCVWYTSKENIFKAGWIKAVDKTGFETLVDISRYIVVNM